MSFRTWVLGETVTPQQMNELRDYAAVLKGFAYDAGQGNAAGPADTQLTSYDVTIPADFLDQPGDALIIEGTFAVLNSAGVKVAKIQISSGTLGQIFSAVASLAQIVPFRVVVRRRTAATGSATGIAWIGAAAAGTPTNYLVNVGIASVDWTAAQTLKIFASATTAGDLRLTDYCVYSARGVAGTTV